MTMQSVNNRLITYYNHAKPLQMYDSMQKENEMPEENEDLIKESFYQELKKQIKQNKLVILNSDYGLLDVVDVDQIYEGTRIMLRTSA